MNALLLIAAMAVRNPFWPIGYEGEKEVISAEPTVEVNINNGADGAEGDETATAGAIARSSQTVSDKNWSDARKQLRVTGTSSVTAADGKVSQSVIINGNTYGNGDLISINHHNRRFTWKVQGLTKGETLKLIRVKARPIDEDKNEKSKENKR